MSHASASAIVELSRSKQRYHDQDALLKGFIGRDGYTAKEVAVEALDWKYEQYANSPKRAFDLKSLGYLEATGQKLCRMTGKEAHSYRITDKGIEHLRGQGVSVNQAVEPPVVDPVPVSVRSQLNEIRKSFEGKV